MSILLVTVLLVLLPQLSGIRCQPACRISPPSLTSKLSSKLSFFNRHFHKSKQTMIVCVHACVHVNYVYICVDISMNGAC